MKKLFFILLSIQFLFATSAVELISGKAVNTSVKKTEKKFYKITVPENKSIHINLTELKADIDLYVKKGNEVRIRFNDCYSSNGGTKNEECILTNKGETSEYSILVYGFEESTYSLKATITEAEEIPTLTSEAIHDSVEHKKSKQYKLSGKKGEAITVTLSDLTADADLRVKVGRKAGLRTFDCKSIKGGTKTDECTITPNEDATVYVHIYGYKSTNYSLKAVQERSNPCITIDELKNKIKDNQDVSHVNTSCITNMDYLFNWQRNFNQDISSWDVSHVISMNHMFSSAEAFNQDLSSWDVSNVENMNNMFSYTPSFTNHDLSGWNVEKVAAKKWFLDSKSNKKPKWNDLNTTLINIAKAHCQNVRQESNTIICSDTDDFVYIINSENDIGSSPWVDSQTYAINLKNGQESIKMIHKHFNRTGQTSLIKLENTNLVAIESIGLHSNNQYLSFFNTSGKKVIDRYFDTHWKRVKELKTIKNGSELIIKYEKEEENPEHNPNKPNYPNNSEYIMKTYKDTYDISNTSNVTLISHVEL